MNADEARALVRQAEDERNKAFEEAMGKFYGKIEQTATLGGRHEIFMVEPEDAQRFVNRLKHDKYDVEYHNFVDTYGICISRIVVSW